MAPIRRQRLLNEGLKKALDGSNGNKSRAAELLGISFRSLRYRLEKLNLE